MGPIYQSKADKTINACKIVDQTEQLGDIGQRSCDYRGRGDRRRLCDRYDNDYRSDLFDKISI